MHCDTAASETNKTSFTGLDNMHMRGVCHPYGLISQQMISYRILSLCCSHTPLHKCIFSVIPQNINPRIFFHLMPIFTVACHMVDGLSTIPGTHLKLNPVGQVIPTRSPLLDDPFGWFGGNLEDPFTCCIGFEGRKSVRIVWERITKLRNGRAHSYCSAW